MKCAISGVVLVHIGLCLSCLFLATRAYIPALASNDSVNESDASIFQVQWFPNASYSATVSYQLVGHKNSTGINKGALVHFSEFNIANGTTITPWIALISCDFNSSDASMENDIFTLAHDRGAVAALLYSQWSETCQINAEFSDPAVLDPVFDVFSTKSLAFSRTVENVFANVNRSLYGDFDPVVLNNSANIINQSIVTGNLPQASYLFATLTANNATDPGNDSGSGGVQPTANSSSSKYIDVAMITLYVFTSMVSFLLCIIGL